ncbi:hypothetical protein ABEB36_008232 [Hypothenemus hampei]|uniref:Uncharacterized protein n=1 Tax=Hypothenemus hampei TaxID=57062 RepID=A0ABD1EL69_HYPHA
MNLHGENKDDSVEVFSEDEDKSSSDTDFEEDAPSRKKIRKEKKLKEKFQKAEMTYFILQTCYKKKT